MKNKLTKILFLLLMLSLAFCLCACFGGNPGEDPGDDPDEPLSGLVLIEDGKAKFKVVTTSGAGSAGIRAARDFVDRLRELGVEVDDVVTDTSADDVTDCEIIIGTGAKHRPARCNIAKDEIGNEGYLIRAVDSRIIIAGGTGNLTRDTLKIFIKDYLGIDGTTTEIESVAVDEELNVFVPTDYNIDSVKIVGRDISQYVIACDQSNPILYPELVGDFQNMLLADTGKRLNIVDIDSAGNDKRIVFRMTSDAGEDGFRVLVSNENLVIECSYPLLFAEGYEKFISDVFKSGKDDIFFTASYKYSTNVSTVSYADFGAIGDGVTNDFFAIYNAHFRVNDTKQTLIAEGIKGNVFYIGKTWEDGTTIGGVIDCNANGNPIAGKSIPIKTDMDFGDATFIIDDTVPGIHVASRRQKHIFTLARESETVTYKSTDGYENQISSLTATPTLSVGGTSISWLKDLLTSLGREEYMVTFKNSDHRDYIRFGSNQNSGDVREDRIIIDKNGRISNDTPIIFEFTNITEIQIIPIDDSPITVQGGRFETIAPIHDYETKGRPDYESYSRGFLVQRPNSTLKNLDHEVFAEPTGRYDSYPSYGFVAFNGTYNSTLSDSKLSGRQLYYGKKAATTSDVAMGSYDLTMNDSIKIYFNNITQYRDIKDEKYWGLSASNGCKNLFFDNVAISRIDAHCGLWNMDIKNSTIGFAINVIGGGDVNIENTTKLSGNDFIYLRQDYGATFNGTVNLKDCHLVGYKSWNSTSTPEFHGEKNSRAYIIESGFDANKSFTHQTEGKKYYNNWDFGYVCYMPRYVNLDNFTVDTGVSLYVYNKILDSAFDTSLVNGGYRITNRITYKNMDKPTICHDSSCTKLLAIPMVAG